jgi:hypothetical protein
MEKLFIAHASEDKDDCARPVADALIRAGCKVWFDEYSLKVGDSLRRSIERGLKEADYGIVVLSPNFFNKNWPQKELDGLFALEMAGKNRILPLWHKVGYEEVLEKSPLLADTIAAKSTEGVPKVVDQILASIRPGNSHLTLGPSTLSVNPSSIRLHTGEWSVKTPIRITNLSDVPAFSVQIKISMEQPEIDPHSLKFSFGNLGQATLEHVPPNFKISRDGYLLYLLDRDGKKSISLLIERIAAKSSLELHVEGMEPKKSSASVTLWDFKDKPAETLRKGKSISFPFTVPEGVQLQGIGVFIRKA